MDHFTVKRLALILAIQAEIEGMKWENEKMKQSGDAMAYEEWCFYEKAEELRILANAHDSQL